MSTEQIWLAEVTLQSFVSDLPTGGRTVTFEEVLAEDEDQARKAAFKQFENRCRYEPVLKRRMMLLGIGPTHCTVKEAVRLDK